MDAKEARALTENSIENAVAHELVAIAKKKILEAAIFRHDRISNPFFGELVNYKVPSDEETALRMLEDDKYVVDYVGSNVVISW